MDSKLDSKGIEELRSAIRVFRPHLDENVSIEELKLMLKTAQRTRTLAFWHDHATILEQGYILMTVHVIYVLMQDKSGNIQTVVEEPFIYLFGLNSSTIEDQAGLCNTTLPAIDLATLPATDLTMQPAIATSHHLKPN